MRNIDTVQPRNSVSEKALNFRETKNRASRFNLKDEEMFVYHQFTNIIASFDENTRIELIESVIKDAMELE